MRSAFATLTRRLGPASRPRWVGLTACLLVGLLAGEPMSTVFRTVALRTEPAEKESKSPGDEDAEVGKLTVMAHPSRRSSRRQFFRHPVCAVQFAGLSHQGHVRLFPNRHRIQSPLGEHANRNGVGAPLRC